MTFIDSYQLVKSKREIIQPNEGFVKQLKEYEQELNESLDNKQFD